ncbi:hypothetical protein H4R24_002959 [Coemansia sp. RSA 988]|nr:hypothetical protein H4R24_002959 [Coemansia sp. RSA 988]
MESNIKLDRFVDEINEMLERSKAPWSQIAILDANLDCAAEIDENEDTSNDDDESNPRAAQELAIQFVEHLPNISELDLMFYSEDDRSCQFVGALEEMYANQLKSIDCFFDIAASDARQFKHLNYLAVGLNTESNKSGPLIYTESIRHMRLYNQLHDHMWMLFCNNVETKDMAKRITFENLKCLDLFFSVLSYHSDMNTRLIETDSLDIYDSLYFPKLSNLRLRIRDSEGRLLLHSHFPEVLKNLEVFHMNGGKASLQQIKFGKRERQMLAKSMEGPSDSVFWSVTNCLFGSRMQPVTSTLTIFHGATLPNADLLNWEYLANLHIHTDLCLSNLQQLLPRMRRLIRLDANNLVVDADSKSRVDKKQDSRQPIQNTIRFLGIGFKDDTRIVRTTIWSIKQLVSGLAALEAATLPAILPNITGFSRIYTSGTWAYHKRIGTPRAMEPIATTTTLESIIH